MRRRMLTHTFLLLWIDFVSSDTCVNRKAWECQSQLHSSHLSCGPLGLWLHINADVVGSGSALLELPPTTGCDAEAVHLSEDFEVHYDDFSGSSRWKISFEAFLPNSSHVLFTTSKKATHLKDRKSPNSSLRILSYVAQDLSMQFYLFNNNGSHSRKSKKLSLAKTSDHYIRITFNVSGDRELDKYSLGRYWLIKNSTTLHCSKWSGEWTQNGCQNVDSDLTQVTCECSFTDHEKEMKMGVLTKVKSLPDSRPAMPLYLILTSLSTLFFALTLVLLVRFRRAYKDANRRFAVQLNLSVSLFLRHTFLLAGYAISLFDPLNRKGCEAMAVLHAYFLVTTVLWVQTEGIIIYRKVCKSSMSLALSSLIVIAALVWGLPFLLLAGVSAYELINDRFIHHTESYRVIRTRLQSIFTDPDIISHELSNYRKYDFCWTTSAFSSYAIGIPVTISLIVNIIILVRVGVVVWKIRVADAKNLPSRSGSGYTGPCRQTKYTFRAVVLLTAMLGIPWLFSLFYNLIQGIVKTDNLAPSYVHFAFVSLQGPALFYLYCLGNHEFRRAFLRSLDRYNVKKAIGSQQAALYVSQNQAG